jgi:hypothetical protein
LGSVSKIDWEGKKEGDVVLFYLFGVDVDYAKTFQLELKEGRFFSSEFSTDSTAVVINEKTAEILGFKDPIGQILSEHESKFRIIGVVHDFHFKTLRSAIEPLVITPIPPSTIGGTCYIRMKPDQTFNSKIYQEYF